MKFENFLLSICIPTINRVEYLKETLDSLVSQDIFINTNLIEIVISDNASIDQTQNMVSSYVDKFPNKIKYYKNEKNILDLNFEKCLSYGNGEFLKLNNDTLVHVPNSLAYMVDIVNRNCLDKPVLFFSNQNISKIEFLHIYNLDNFLLNTGYISTWIGSFGIWKSDFKMILNFNKSSNLQLIQFDIILEQIKVKQNAIIINQVLGKTNSVKSKGGYDLITVFLDNTSIILGKYLEDLTLSKHVFISFKKRIISEFILKWILRMELNNEYFFSMSEPLERIKLHIENDVLFYYRCYLLIEIKLLALRIYKYMKYIFQYV